MTESQTVLSKGCKVCNQIKPLDDFHVSRLNRLGRKTICRACISRSILAHDYPNVAAPDTKFCGTCKQVKPGTEFNRHRRHPDGLATQCRACHKVQHRKHYERHRIEMLSKTGEWRQKHPDKTYEYKNRHRARRLGREGEFTADEWAELKRRYRYRCLRCGAFEGSLWAPQLSPDHIVPLSRGGSNTIDNIQPLCVPCNRWKRSKIIDFRQRRHQMEKVWLRPPFGQGEPKEVEAAAEVLIPMMVAGWAQCDPPPATEEVTTNVHD